MDDQKLDLAAEAISDARRLLIHAGAGMGVDSGLPDFRGNKGFWRAYPPFRKLALSFVDMANPTWFDEDPELAWGFYGHRLDLYRKTEPHAGFQILRRWAEQVEDHFVFTSNVDGQFQKAGFSGDRIGECHGTIHRLQCTGPCCRRIWPAEGVELEVDETTMRAASELPRCPECGAVARPNLLMFGDWRWVPRRTDEQMARFERVRNGADEPGVVIEVGAGTAVPTVRSLSDRLARGHRWRLVRINPRESVVPPGQIALAMGGLEALQEIQGRLET